MSRMRLILSNFEAPVDASNLFAYVRQLMTATRFQRAMRRVVAVTALEIVGRP